MTPNLRHPAQMLIKKKKKKKKVKKKKLGKKKLDQNFFLEKKKKRGGGGGQEKKKEKKKKKKKERNAYWGWSKVVENGCFCGSIAHPSARFVLERTAPAAYIFWRGKG